MSEEEKVPHEENAENGEEAPMKISRRDFIVGAGAGVVVTGAAAAGISAFRGPQIQREILEIEIPVEVVRTVETLVEGDAPALVSAAGLPAHLRAVSLNIDGTTHELVVDVRESLWEVMVSSLGIGTVNMGCDRAQCGACAVTVDGRSVNGCTVLAARLGRGQEILTVAGLSKGSRVEDLHPIANAFWQENGFQCGICTRGFIMATYDLLSRNPDPTDDEISEGLAGNICRCSEYPFIFKSVRKAAEDMRAA
jgi:carbon-monoxide dehydrogenase small subunit